MLDEVEFTARQLVHDGEVPGYLPGPARQGFGFAVATVDGAVHGVGDCHTEVSVQSVSKVFALVAVLARQDRDLWRRVGREPSGSPFNSLVQLEHERGVPRNPFINAGALVVTDELLTLTGDASASVLDLLRLCGEHDALSVDEEVVASEIEHGARTAAMAHLMASFGNLRHPVDEVLAHYFRQCSVTMSCVQLARAGLLLARHGVLGDGTRLLGHRPAKRVNAIMLTCGTYDAAGEFTYRVGLPGKSGVGGAILAIAPGRGAVCAWSPRLDRQGNSIAAVAALDVFTTLTGWSVC